MKVIDVIPMRNAEIHKINKLYEIRLFNFNQYIESFYCRKKSDIKQHLKKIDYILAYDYTLKRV